MSTMSLSDEALEMMMDVSNARNEDDQTVRVIRQLVQVRTRARAAMLAEALTILRESGTDWANAAAYYLERKVVEKA